MHNIDPIPGALRDMKIVFLNGPPRCGKDTAGKAIRKHLTNAETAKMAGPLKRSVHADFNLPPNTSVDAFEDCKDTPSAIFFGMSPREAYIYKSEKIMKEHFGQKIYGQLALRTLWRHYQMGIHLIAFTDSGFAPEAEPVIDAVDPANCILLRIHAEQRGKSFNGDSRSYINLPGILTLDVDNQVEGLDGQAAFERDVVSTVRSLTWLRE